MQLTAGIRSDGVFFGPGDEARLLASPQANTVDWVQLQALGIVVLAEGETLPAAAAAPSQAKKGKKGA